MTKGKWRAFSYFASPCQFQCCGIIGGVAKLLEHRLLLLPQLPRELNMSQMYGAVTDLVQDAPPDSDRVRSRSDGDSPGFSELRAVQFAEDALACLAYPLPAVYDL